MNLDAVDPTFVSDLLASQRSVQRVAAWLQGRGFRTRVPELHVRPDVAERLRYSDDGDLFYEERIEVKHRPELQFTSAADFPYRDGIIVDVCRSWDRAHPKPIAYMICNKTLTHAAVVRRDSAKSWRKVSMENHGRVREFYVAPLDVVTFVRLEA